MYISDEIRNLFVKLTQKAYDKGYFKVSDESECGCMGLHISTPNNAFYALPLDAETWEGTPEEYVSHLGKDNVINDIAQTVMDMLQEEIREDDLGEGYGYVLEIAILLTDDESQNIINKILSMVMENTSSKA